MAEEPSATESRAAEVTDSDPDSPARTLTDLIDELEREAFSRSLSARPTGSSRRPPASGNR